ncbi:MAG TPA: hypothetical protein VH092_06985, partial [Urbifossiella sp.]|nr:hypothetical protein [Urbifossiella sp.]
AGAAPPAAAPGPRIPLIGEGGGKAGELRAVARAALRRLEAQLAAAAPKAKDPSTAAHLEDALAEVREILSGGKK